VRLLYSGDSMANTGDGVLSEEEILLENAKLAEMAEMHSEMAEVNS